MTTTESQPTILAGRKVPLYIKPTALRGKRMLTNVLLLSITGLTALITLALLFWIVGYVVYRGGQSINLAFLTQTPRPVGMAGGGVLHAIEGTVLLTLLASLFALPPGILAAFYVAYHPNGLFGMAVRFGTDVLAGVPSIVIGIFCYTLVVKPAGHFSALAGGIALAILMLPTIIRTTEEMLKMVPNSLKAGSLALGAPEWETAIKVTFPTALNGMVTGVLLGIARASGETAPLLFTALGNDRFEIGRALQVGLQNHQSIFAILSNIIQQPVDSLPLTLFKYTQQPFPERINQSWGVALVLIVMVIVTNMGARLWERNLSRRTKGR